MEQIFLVTKLLSLIIFVLIFYDLKLGVVAYVCYLFLVPIPTFGVLPVSLLSISLFGMSVYKYGIVKLKKSFNFVCPYLFLLVTLGVVMPISPTPLSFQFWMWRTDFINGFLSTWALCLIMLNSNLSFEISKIIVFLSFIVGIYALVLTQTDGINPYVFGLKILTGGDVAENWYADENRLFGRISSTFIHPMTWAFVVGTLSIFTFFIRHQLNKYLLGLLSLILFLDVLFCGVRSVIGALLVSIVVYLILIRQFKVVIYVAMISVVALFVLSTNDVLSDYIQSIFDFKGSNELANGSNFSMRTNQLLAAFREMGRNPIIGNGYSWHSYYLQTFGDHPDLLAFESLIFTVLCNSGILGVAVWLGYLFLLCFLPFRYLKQKEDIYIIVSFVFYYIAYSCVTGDFSGYFFLWFYTIMFSLSYKKMKSLEQMLFLKSIK